MRLARVVNWVYVVWCWRASRFERDPGLDQSGLEHQAMMGSLHDRIAGTTAVSGARWVVWPWYLEQI